MHSGIDFKIFTWKSRFHNQYYLKDREPCIYQIIKWENKKTYLELVSNLGLFKSFGFYNQRSSLLFSLISKCVHWVDTFLIPIRDFWDGRTIKEKLFFFLFLYSYQNSLFFPLLFFLSMSPNDHLPKISHFKSESLNGLVGILWKACWTKIF